MADSCLSRRWHYRHLGWADMDHELMWDTADLGVRISARVWVSWIRVISGWIVISVTKGIGIPACSWIALSWWVRIPGRTWVWLPNGRRERISAWGWIRIPTGRRVRSRVWRIWIRADGRIRSTITHIISTWNPSWITFTFRIYCSQLRLECIGSSIFRRVSTQ